jgi:hypothetical protein
VAGRANGRLRSFSPLTSEADVRHRITLLLLALLTSGALAGCGAGREKGKNSDLDRPKSTAR